VNEIDPEGHSAAVIAGAMPLVLTLPRIALPAMTGTVLVGALRASILLWGLESVGEMGVYAATGGHLEGPTMQLGKTLIASHIPAVQSGIAADPHVIMMWEASTAKGQWLPSTSERGKAQNGEDFHATSYENAMKAALGWLAARGFNAAQTNLSRGVGGTQAGIPFGKTSADGNLGFRVEWDPDALAHINVFDNAAKGAFAPHFYFPGSKEAVESLQKVFGK